MSRKVCRNGQWLEQPTGKWQWQLHSQRRQADRSRFIAHQTKTFNCWSKFRPAVESLYYNGKLYYFTSPLP